MTGVGSAQLAKPIAAHAWAREANEHYVEPPRPSMPPGHVIAAGEKPAGGKMDFCWLVFEHGYGGSPELCWLRRSK